MNYIKILFIMLAAVAFISCEDILETKAVNDVGEKDVWRIPEYAEGTLLTVYNAIPARFDTYGGNFLDVATDNALTNSYSSDIYKFATGQLSRNLNPLGDWSNGYTQIQAINLFMEKGLSDNVVYDNTDEEINAAIKKRLLGESHFLRAWWNFYLLRLYGGKTDDGEALGIPLVDYYITPEKASDWENFKRASYKDCINKIMEDCDKAIELLPDTYTGSHIATGVTNVGRATAMAARVLKANAVLYGASPAYQPDDIVRITGPGQFTVSDEEQYRQGWEYAAQVCDEIIRTDGFGNFMALTHNNIANNTGATPANFVFRFYFNTNGMEARHFPPFYYGNAQTVPSHNLVEAFPSKTGFPITDPRSQYDPDDPYAMERDNRFNLNIYYQGRTFATNREPIDVSYGAKDSPTFSPKASRTGYYLSKFLSRQDYMLEPTAKATAGHYTPVLRKSEVFYNFAEAANEAYGPHGKGDGFKYSAYEVVKIIRAAYGITDTEYLDEVSQDKDKFRELIQNERRLEFAFENHRFFDMRRWLLKLDESVMGVAVTNDAGTYAYSYEEVESRPFSDIRHYYLPLPYEEIMKNPALKNNMGWDNY